MDSMGNQQVHVSFSIDALEPLIEEVIERVLAKQVKVNRTADAVQEQLIFTEAQAARKLGLSPVALKEERLKGRIQYLKRGKQIKYLPEHLVDYVTNWADADD